MKLIDKVMDLDARALQYMEAFLYFGEDANNVCSYSFEDAELYLDLLSFGYSIEEAELTIAIERELGRELVLDLILANSQICLKPLELLEGMKYNNDLDTVRIAMRMGLRNPDFLSMLNRDNVMLLVRAKNYNYSAMEIDTADALEIRRMLVNTCILEETNKSKLDKINSLIKLLENNFDDDCINLIRDIENYSIELDECNVKEMVAFNSFDEFIKPIYDITYLDTDVLPLENVNFMDSAVEKEPSPDFHYSDDVWADLERWDHYSTGSF